MFTRAQQRDYIIFTSDVQIQLMDSRNPLLGPFLFDESNRINTKDTKKISKV